MNKAILVIDMPRNCMECGIRFMDEYSDWCPVHVKDEQEDVYNYKVSGTKPDWCPLRELPKKSFEGFLGDWSKGYQVGWNKCIDEILGEEV